MLLKVEPDQTFEVIYFDMLIFPVFSDPESTEEDMKVMSASAECLWTLYCNSLVN